MSYALLRLHLFLSRLKQTYLTVPVLAPIAVAAALYCAWPELSVTQPPGILAPQAPVLTSPSVIKTTFPYKKYTVTPLADYELTARVLDRNSYHWGRNADIAPIDMVLGWQYMSDTEILRNFSFTLNNRWYRWHASELPLPEDEINDELDNNHLIPSTVSIEHQMKRTRIGQIVHIEGFLVRVDDDDGYNWSSSLSIGSTGGPQSCKLIYVLKFETVR